MNNSESRDLETELGVKFDLNPIFFPKSMVVVGVSLKNYLNPGTLVYMKNLFEMEIGDRTYGINSKGGILESRKIYTKMADLPENPDVAVIAVNAEHSLISLKECIDKSVKGVIIIGGGFAETGNKIGKEIQQEMKKICLDSNTPLIGPNCVGVYNPPNIETIFLPTEKLSIPKKGNVAIVSQSGGILLDQFFLSFQEREIGVSSAISIGNKAVINESHMLDYYSKDNETSCIAFYIEGFETLKGREFLHNSTKVDKDIIIYQGGKTDNSKRAVLSHTAGLSSNFAISHSAFKQFGLKQPQTEEEVLNYIKTFSMLSYSKHNISLEAIEDGFVGILTVSGGHGVICADLLEHYELKLVKFSHEEILAMKSLTNETCANIGSFNNPIDLTGAVADDDIVRVLDYLMQNEKIDILILIVVPYPPKITIQIGRRISLTARKYDKPLVCFVPYIEKYDLIRDSLELYHIPVAHTVSETVQMAAAIRDKCLTLQRKRHIRSVNI